MELEEFIDHLEALYIQAEAIRGISYLLWSSLLYDRDSDHTVCALAANHLYCMIESFNLSLQQELRLIYPIAMSHYH